MGSTYYEVYEVIVVPEVKQPLPINQGLRFDTKEDAESWIVERMRLPAYTDSVFGIKEVVPIDTIPFEKD